MRFLFLIICCVLTLVSEAQDPIEVQIAEVKIIDKPVDAFTREDSLSSIVLDRQLRLTSESFVNILNQESSIYIRQTGPGLLSTPLAKGLPARHFKILWNGIPLNSAFNGVIDLSLIDPSSVSKIELKQSNGSSLMSEGSPSGYLRIVDSYQFQKKNNSLLKLSLSNMDNIYGAFSSQWRFSNLHQNVYLSYSNNKNRYRFLNQGVNVTQESAEAESFNLKLNNLYFIGPNSQLEANIWIQRNDREIPPIKIAADTGQIQNDESNRFVLNYQWMNNGFNVLVRSAYFFEGFDFESSVVPLSTSRNRQFIQEIMLKSSNTKLFEWLTGVKFQYDRFQYDEDGTQSDKRFTWYGFLEKNLVSNWRFSLGFRQGIRNNDLEPLAISMNAYKSLSHILFHFSAERFFAPPGLNDLYWPVLGNENLLSESGYAFKLNISNDRSSNSKFYYKTGLFYNVVDNWIVWAPDEFAIFRPENRRQVNSVGLEAALGYSFSIRSLTIKNRINYSFSKTLVKKAQDDNIVGKQLIFVPIHNLSYNLGLDWRRLEIMFFFKTVGRHYLTNDNSLEQPGYNVADVSFNYRFNLMNTSVLSVGVQVNNLFNSDYEIVANYPMPLRNVSLNVLYEF